MPSDVFLPRTRCVPSALHLLRGRERAIGSTGKLLGGAHVDRTMARHGRIYTKRAPLKARAFSVTT